MALNDKTKLNYPWKKINDKTHTSNQKDFYEEGRNSALGITNPALVWVSPLSENPAIAVSQNLAFEVYETLVEDVTVGEHRAHFRESNDYKVIPPAYGKNYIIELIDDTGKKIPSGHDVGWLFDYVSGTLSFERPPESYGLVRPFHIHGYVYTGKTLLDILGGLTQIGILGTQVCSDGTLIVAFGDPFDLIETADVYKYNEDTNQYEKIQENLPIY